LYVEVFDIDPKLAFLVGVSAMDMDRLIAFVRVEE
jgi:hypothetical protein